MAGVERGGKRGWSGSRGIKRRKEKGSIKAADHCAALKHEGCVSGF